MTDADVSAHDGRIRFRLREDWMLHDFSALLRRSSLSYSGLNAFLYLSDNRDPELWDTLWRRYERAIRVGRHITPSLIVSPTIDAISDKTVELDLSRVQLSSPGIVEALGSLNVIKLMADFIANWRKETTERERVSYDYEVRMREEDRKDRQMEIAADIRMRELSIQERETLLRTIGAAYDSGLHLVAQLAKQEGKLDQHVELPSLGELVVKSTVERPFNLLQLVALERRVQAVTVREVALPVERMNPPEVDSERQVPEPRHKHRRKPELDSQQQGRLF